MGLAEIRAIKKMTGLYEGEMATTKVIASLQPKVKKPIAKQSAKKKAQAADDKIMDELDKVFYAEVWAASPHVCQCGCKANLGKEPLKTMFHHVLFKAQYPAFRHLHENIMLLLPACHYAYHFNPDSRPNIKARQIELLKKLL